jgi:hypothetical protein
MKRFVETNSIDFWFNALPFLQQNWVLIKKGRRMYFFGKVSGDFVEDDFSYIEESSSLNNFL